MLVSAMGAICPDLWNPSAHFKGDLVTPQLTFVPKGLKDFQYVYKLWQFLLDHLAEHMIYLSTASLFWFSLHGCHLSQHLFIAPMDYKYFLVAANLAHFHKTLGFSTIKKMKWILFLEGHWLSTSNCPGTFKVGSKKFNLNELLPEHREQVYFF